MNSSACQATGAYMKVDFVTIWQRAWTHQMKNAVKSHTNYM